MIALAFSGSFPVSTYVAIFICCAAGMIIQFLSLTHTVERKKWWFLIFTSSLLLIAEITVWLSCENVLLLSWALFVVKYTLALLFGAVLETAIFSAYKILRKRH